MEEIFEFLTGVRVYFEKLLEINFAFIDLVALDSKHDAAKIGEATTIIAQKSFQIIPCTTDIDRKTAMIMRNDNILAFSKTVPFIDEEIKRLMEAHNNFFFNMKQIRDRCEYQIHDLAVYKTEVENAVVSFRDDKYIINREEAKRTLMELNSIFIRLLNQIKEFEKYYENNINNEIYFGYLKKFDFEVFNRVYSSPYLSDVSKIMTLYDMN